MATSTTTSGGLRAPLRPLVHVGAGREEQAALREALEPGMATIHGDRMLSPVVLTMSAASIDVHADAPNYRPPSTTVSKKECDERRRAKAMHAWQSGAHQLGGAAGVAGGARWMRWGLRTSRRMAALVWPPRCRDAGVRRSAGPSGWRQQPRGGAAAAGGRRRCVCQVRCAFFVVSCASF